MAGTDDDSVPGYPQDGPGGHFAMDDPSTSTPLDQQEIEAEFTLESPAACPHCKDVLHSVQVIRLLRTRVNFVSSLPRRGQVMVCPSCKAVLSGSLGGFI